MDNPNPNPNPNPCILVQPETILEDLARLGGLGDNTPAFHGKDTSNFLLISKPWPAFLASLFCSV